MTTRTLTTEINAPIGEVFRVTTDPSKTPVWIPSLRKEESSAFPPEMGTTYRNTSDGTVWDDYLVEELVPNQTFLLAKVGSTYRVQYSY